MTEIQDRLKNDNNNKAGLSTAPPKNDRNRKLEECRSRKELAELGRAEWGSTWEVGGKVKVSILGTGSGTHKGMKLHSTEARLENRGLLL